MANFKNIDLLGESGPVTSLSNETKSAEEVVSLAGSLGRIAFVLTGILLGSLVCNILALVYPFLEFSAAFKGKEFYSIPLTISLMWDFGLYAAAILVVAFSLTFPFVKLAMLLATIWVPIKISPDSGFTINYDEE